MNKSTSALEKLDLTTIASLSPTAANVVNIGINQHGTAFRRNCETLFEYGLYRGQRQIKVLRVLYTYHTVFLQPDLGARVRHKLPLDIVIFLIKIRQDVSSSRRGTAIHLLTA